MEEKVERRMCMDALETVSLRLGQLNNMIKSLSIGMQQENIEQQAVDCMNTIKFIRWNCQRLHPIYVGIPIVQIWQNRE